MFAAVGCRLKKASVVLGFEVCLYRFIFSSNKNYGKSLAVHFKKKTTMFAKLQILYMAQCRTGKGVGMKINLRHIHDAFNGIYPILF